MGGMKLISVKIPQAYLDALDFLVKVKKCYPNRSEAIRVAIRDLVNKEAKKIANIDELEKQIVKKMISSILEEKKNE